MIIKTEYFSSIVKKTLCRRLSFFIVLYDKLILHLRGKMKQGMQPCKEISEQIKPLIWKVLKSAMMWLWVQFFITGFKIVFQHVAGVGGAVLHQVSHQAVNVNWNALHSQFKHLVFIYCGIFNQDLDLYFVTLIFHLCCQGSGLKWGHYYTELLLNQIGF